MSDEVRRMFAGIAKDYDRMNDIISFGAHSGWKKKLVRLSGAKKGDSVLDAASGTGDLALGFKRAVGVSGRVVATDFCEDMLGLIPAKAEKNSLDVEIMVEDATAFSFADSSFDIASISYGIRNVDDPVKCLAEMARVVKPGGTVAVLETGRPEGLPGFFYRIYARRIMPFLGQMFAGQKEAYTYLPQTAGAFPCGGDFEKMMESTGRFSGIRTLPLMFGASYIYIARVIK